METRDGGAALGADWRRAPNAGANFRARGVFLRHAVATGVPDLTRIRDIKLNNRVSLRRQAKSIASRHRTLPSSGSSVAKSSVDYIPAGGFVFPPAIPVDADPKANGTSIEISSFTESAAWRREKRRHGLG